MIIALGWVIFISACLSVFNYSEFKQDEYAGRFWLAILILCILTLGILIETGTIK